MLLFIFAIICLVAGLFAGLYSRSARKRIHRDKDTFEGAKGADYVKALIGLGLTVILILIGALSAFNSVTSRVQVRSLGVVTSFGHIDDVYEPGFHWKKPWQNVNTLDGSKQKTTYNGDHRVEVKLKNNSRAYLDVDVQWQLPIDNKEQMVKLFSEYKDIDNIYKQTVDLNLNSALNEAFQDYDPLSADAQGNSTSGLPERSANTQKALEERLGGQIQIHTFNLSNISFDEETQKRIDAFQTEVAKTRQAEQREKTAEAEARANQKLQQDISEETLQSKCLDIAKENNKEIWGCLNSGSATPIKEVP